MDRCPKRVIHIRWSDATPEDPDSSAGWWLPSIIVATLFLNFPFWLSFDRSVPLLSPPVAYFGLLGGIALLLVSLFYLGPALAAQSSQRSMFHIAQFSFGTILALGFRLCCALYLVIWLTFSVQTIGFLMVQWPYHRGPTTLESGLIATAITLFLFVTALQGMRTNAKLAWFTNKLSLALLIAALIRVREGLPSAWEALAHAPGFMQSTDWRSIPFILFYFAPLALFSSDFAYRTRTRRDATLIGLVGLALAFAFSLFAAALMAQAAHGLRANFSNDRTMATALFQGISRRYFPPRMMVTAITMFGSARFGIRALANSVPFEGRTTRVILGVLACSLIIFTVATPDSLYAAREMLTRCLVAATAVLSADFIAGTWRLESPKNVDWIGATALFAGLAITLVIPADLESWWFPWLLPSYAASFVTCWVLRIAMSLFARRPRQLQ